jgi:hypothetical protein
MGKTTDPPRSAIAGGSDTKPAATQATPSQRELLPTRQWPPHLTELDQIDVTLMGVRDGIAYLPDQIAEKTAPWLDELDGKLSRIATALERIAQPKLPVGTHAIVFGNYSQGDGTEVLAHGEVMAYEAGTLWLRDLFGNGDLLPIRLHEGEDDNPDEWRVYATFHYSETDFSTALHEAYEAQRERRTAKA